MNILLFLEPVIYRDDPDALEAHFPWVESFRRVAEQIDGSFAIVANPETISAWKMQEREGVPVETFPIDPFFVLSEFANKIEYSKALYRRNIGTSRLVSSLRAIREKFKPDVVITTAQNAFAVKAFRGVAMLHVEQPPLPRMGHLFRTGIDPKGHQISSLIETYRARIQQIEIPAGVRRQAGDLLQHVRESRAYVHPYAREACDALQEVRGRSKVALLATQPTDAVTYEGAYRNISLHELLFEWAEQLPKGWIGVPTYHPGQRLSEELEHALKRSTNRLRFLPSHLSVGLSEALIENSDGLVTISSTSAMAALLSEKKVVVVGKSPFSHLSVNKVEDIDQHKILSQDEAVKYFSILSHRFSIRHDLAMQGPDVLERYFAKAVDGSIVDWYLNLNEWREADAEKLFARPNDLTLGRREDGVRGNNGSVDLASDARESSDEPNGAARVPANVALAANEQSHGGPLDLFLKAESLRVELQAAIADRDRIDLERLEAVSHVEVMSGELQAAVADRDRIDGEREDAILRADVIEGELKAAVADRDRIDVELQQRTSQSKALEEALASAVGDRDRIDAERQQAVLRADLLQRELQAAIIDRDETSAALLQAASQREVLETALASAVADRDRFDGEREDALIRADVIEGELKAAVADRDRIDVELQQRTSQSEALEEALAAAVGDRDRIDAERQQAVLRADLLQRELQAAIIDRDETSAALLQAASQREVLETALASAVADRDRIDGEREDAILRADVIEGELKAAVADRDRIDVELQQRTSQSEALEEALAAAVGDRDRIDAERQQAVLRADLLQRELQAAIIDRDETSAALLQAASQREVLETALASAVADRDRIDGEREDALIRADVIEGELKAAVADRDRIDVELQQRTSQSEALGEALASAVGDRDRIDAERQQAVLRADLLQRELQAAIIDRDRLDALNSDACLHRDLLSVELARAVADRDNTDRALAILIAQHDALRATFENQQRELSALKVAFEHANQSLHDCSNELRASREAQMASERECAELSRRLIVNQKEGEFLSSSLRDRNAEVASLGEAVKLLNHHLRSEQARLATLQSQLNAVRAFWGGGVPRRLAARLLGYQKMDAALQITTDPELHATDEECPDASSY